ncbi:uncharacterized protein PHACADRAFT_33458 [Phanerochaete carnosa HHB-10118-sp]|uniref:Uncharacterized protein n=1 Tax=Phanerochaete carnosa (strain HHB-10118-sp) TaxID=650164 RepID=K5UIP9_PHACS|nr:uncharacterized protein PHACADRAFT_33458 [Phanerochaete carnosa HHB-10118-sp]EKM49391.1 hypothetical protein PHACADRAFT_33458 [Phanerochaete carnosa HHB-10118-sp]
MFLPRMDGSMKAELSQKKKSTSGAFTYALEDTTLDMSPGEDGILRIEFKTHTEAETAKLPGWKVFRPEDTFPQRMPKLFGATLAAQSQCFKLASQASGDASATLALHIKLIHLQDALAVFPQQDLLLYQLPRKAWWEFRALRISAVRAVMKRLSDAPPDVCIWEESLALGAVCTSILNSCVIPQLESKEMCELLDQVAYQFVPTASNANQAEMGYNAGNSKPWIEERGAYFVADVIQNSIGDQPNAWFYRVPKRIKLSEELLIVIYRQESASHLRRQFHLGSHRTKLVRLNYRTNRRLHKGKDTLLADAVSKRPLGAELTFDNIAELDIQLTQPATRRGRDTRGVPVSRYDKDDDMLKGSLVEVLNRMYRQLAHDIMNKSPNRRGGGGAYTTLGLAEITAVSPELYFHFDLPFISARVLHCSETVWDTVVENLLPGKAHMASASTTAYPACTYFKAWTTLLNRLNDDNASLVVMLMRNEVSQFLWLPRTEKGAMWATRKEPMAGCIALPEEKIESSPFIAANPQYVKGPETMKRFSLR